MYLGANMFVAGLLASARYYLQSVSWYLDRPINKPTYVTIGITNRCCLHCRMCTMWQNREPETSLSTQDKIDLMVRLRSWLGPYQAVLSGGEPFLKAAEVLTLAGTIGAAAFYYDGVARALGWK